MRRLNVTATGLLLAAVALCLHGPAVWYGFAYYDDVRILRNHPELYAEGSLRDSVQAICVRCFPREEPLPVRDLSWAVDSRLFGFGNPMGYHLANVGLHGAVVALLFVFLLGTTGRYAFAVTTAIGYMALAVHVEPVAWIMGRKDILSAFCMLLALCAQTRRLTAGGILARCAWHVLVLACVIGGLLSKISVLTFPLVLLAHAVLFPYLRGERASAAPLRWGRPFAVEILFSVPLCAASCVVYVWYHRTLAQMGIFERGYTAAGARHAWNLLMIDPMAFWLYLRQTFLPSHLSVLYTWPTLASTYPPAHVAAALATVVAAAAAGIWLFLRRKDLVFYYLAFFLLMVPYMNIAYIGIWAADRYIYFSSFCLLALAVAAGAQCLQRPHPAWRVSAGVAAAIFLAVNLRQKCAHLAVWRSAETLWQYHIALPEPSVTAYENLAAYYYAVATESADPSRMAGLLRKMEAVVNAGLDRFAGESREAPSPNAWHLFFLRAIVEEVRGMPESAVRSYEISDRLHGGFDAASLNLSRLYRSMAGQAKDPRQREEYARKAWERFAQYLRQAFRGRPPSPEAVRERESLKQEFPFLI